MSLAVEDTEDWTFKAISNDSGLQVINNNIEEFEDDQPLNLLSVSPDYSRFVVGSSSQIVVGTTASLYKALASNDGNSSTGFKSIGISKAVQVAWLANGEQFVIAFADGLIDICGHELDRQIHIDKFRGSKITRLVSLKLTQQFAVGVLGSEGRSVWLVSADGISCVSNKTNVFALIKDNIVTDIDIQAPFEDIIYLDISDQSGGQLCIAVRAEEEGHQAFIQTDGEWQEVEEACPAFGDTSKSFAWFDAVLPSFPTKEKLTLISACSHSTDFLLSTSEKKLQVIDDSDKLPFTSEDEDIVALGGAVLINDAVLINPIKGVDQAANIPVWLILTQEGRILGWHIVSKEAIGAKALIHSPKKSKLPNLIKVHGANKVSGSSEVSSKIKNRDTNAVPPSEPKDKVSAFSLPQTKIEGSAPSQPKWGQASLGSANALTKSSDEVQSNSVENANSRAKDFVQPSIESSTDKEVFNLSDDQNDDALSNIKDKGAVDEKETFSNQKSNIDNKKGEREEEVKLGAVSKENKLGSKSEMNTETTKPDVQQQEDNSELVAKAKAAAQKELYDSTLQHEVERLASEKRLEEEKLRKAGLIKKFTSTSSLHSFSDNPQFLDLQNAIPRDADRDELEEPDRIFAETNALFQFSDNNVHSLEADSGFSETLSQFKELADNFSRLGNESKLLLADSRNNFFKLDNEHQSVRRLNSEVADLCAELAELDTVYGEEVYKLRPLAYSAAAQKQSLLKKLGSVNNKLIQAKELMLVAFVTNLKSNLDGANFMVALDAIDQRLSQCTKRLHRLNSNGFSQPDNSSDDKTSLSHYIEPKTVNLSVISHSRNGNKSGHEITRHVNGLHTVQLGSKQEQRRDRSQSTDAKLLKLMHRKPSEFTSTVSNRQNALESGLETWKAHPSLNNSHTAENTPLIIPQYL